MFVSFELIATIRSLINESIIQNDLIINHREDWLRLTSALDAIDDASCAVEFYVKDSFPDNLGGKYLFAYGLLQSLYVIEDSVTSIGKALFGMEIKFSEKENKKIHYTRNVRDDIQHASDRGRKEKRYIYLTQFNLSKNYFEYHKQTSNKYNVKPYTIDVMNMIKEHNLEINQILCDFVGKLENKIQEHKDRFKEHIMEDIFNGLIYAEEKMSQNQYMFGAGYNSAKRMVDEYKKALDERYVSWEACDSDKYEIQYIEKIYDFLDNMLSQIEDVKIRNTIKDIAIDDLCKHLDILHDYAKEHDCYFANSNNHIKDDIDEKIDIQIEYI